MKTCKRFYFVVPVTMLATLLLFPRATSVVPIALAGRTIPFSEHIIDDWYAGVSIYAVDLDGNMDVDILSATDNRIDWWRNDGNESFTYRNVDGFMSGIYSVYATDMDGDGDVDVLGTPTNISWWENDGSESFTKHAIADNTAGARSVYATDLDSDGDLDVLGAAYSTNDITWWENDSSENFTAHIIDGNFDGAHSVYATDVDGDGDVDVLGAAYWDYDITWWENGGSENFTKHIIDDNFSGAQSVYAIDLDSDGDVDVLGAAEIADEIAWWENDGSENFTEHTVVANFYGARSVYATDVDGDGDVDILGVANQTGDIAWWENDGNKNFTRHTISEYFNGARSVYATDMDNDGDVDILGASGDVYPGNDLAWWEQGLPSWVIFLPTVLKNAGPPRSPAVLDAISNPDGDGNYTVSWSTVSGATTYILEEDDDNAFSSPTTVYSGSDTSKSISGKDVGTYYYHVKASNSFGSSDWSNTESVTVTVPPPACEVSCSTPSGYCSGSWSVGLSCESGSYYQSSDCYYCDIGGIIGTCCDVTRTYSESGYTYDIWVYYYNYAGYPQCRLTVNIWGGVFGDDRQYCQNY